MIRRSGSRFSEKITLNHKDISCEGLIRPDQLQK